MNMAAKVNTAQPYQWEMENLINTWELQCTAALSMPIDTHTYI